MGSNSSGKLPKDGDVEGSETTIEIKVKTLDSRIYTLRVDKQVPVPALKEQIASVTGVLSEQQRLICRGRVLNDNQLLSAYHVEDGHTLHLVVRQPVPPSPDGQPNPSANDTASAASHRQGIQVSPSVVIETFNIQDQGNGVPPEVSRIVSAILGSFGFPNTGNGGDGVDAREHGPQRLERTSGASGMLYSTQLQAELAGMRSQSDRPRSAFALPTMVSLGSLQPPVIPDSLTTLSQYLSQIRRDFDGVVGSDRHNARATAVPGTEERDSNSESHLGTVQEGLPTPASLREVMLSTRQMLIEQVGECLLQLVRQLEDQAPMTDLSERMRVQTGTVATGALFHNLGAFMLELGRTIMTIRLGHTPSNSVVNAGPAIFISPSGPNPLMVQPLPFQAGGSFGINPTVNLQSGSSLGNGHGTGFLPRRIDIQIRRGLSGGAPSVNREERGDTQRPSGQRNSATSSGLYFPVLESFQNVAQRHMNGERGSQASSEHLFPRVQAEQRQVPGSVFQQQNAEDPARNGRLPNPNFRQQEPSNCHGGGTVNNLSTGSTENNQETQRQISSSVVQLLRGLFPGSEINIDDASLHGTATRPVPDHAAPSGGFAGAEPSVTEEGIFLSNILGQIMPLISQITQRQRNASEPRMTQGSSSQAENANGETSGQPDDSESGPPNPKRQKME